MTTQLSKTLGLLLLAALCSGCLHTDNYGADDLSQGDDHDRLVAVARLTERRGDREQAKQLYEGLIRRGVALDVANHRLAVIAAREGDLQSAMKYFEVAKQSGQDSAEFDTDLGYAMLLSGQFEKAEAEFNKALRKNPTEKRALNNLAILRGSQGRFDESLAYSQRAVGAAKAQANLGYLLAQFGNVAEAVDSYHLALARDPKIRVAAQALLQLDEAGAQLEPSASRSDIQLASNSPQHELVPEPALSTAREAPQPVPRNTKRELESMEAEPTASRMIANDRLSAEVPSHHAVVGDSRFRLNKPASTRELQPDVTVEPPSVIEPQPGPSILKVGFAELVGEETVDWETVDAKVTEPTPSSKTTKPADLVHFPEEDFDSVVASPAEDSGRLVRLPQLRSSRRAAADGNSNLSAP